MSTIRNPVGPQPTKVYWRRRVMVLLGLLAVVVVVLLIVFRPGSGSASPNPTETPEPSETAVETEPAGDPAAEGAADAEGAEDAVAYEPVEPTIPETEAAVEGGTDCKESNVAVTARTDQVDYAAGVQPQLTLAIENTGSKPCVIDAGTAAQVFTIKSGEEQYWTSTDCAEGAVSTEITLEPGKTVVSGAPIVWDRTRSAPDTCDGEREAVPAGGAAYWLTVSVDGIEDSQGTQFLLY
ncbi:hypothetical protein [Agromyces seonyuensis]|uniref:DUF4232 domain-containing protein n=1 Tax=Agromyces seonyuensis TaxID=2662446 RepID=A0A6I4NXU9_9MICO|nr:hypothetical protein [Agromyces seonyuensis]MWB99078.1 hypothetical protein [Agromyces seonyuensis]